MLSFIKDFVIFFLVFTLANLLHLSFWTEFFVIIGILIVGEIVLTVIRKKRSKSSKDKKNK